MKLLLISCLIFLESLTANGQEALYGFVKLGNYKVGFTDTLVLDPAYDYEAYGYKGKKPCFLQIWHPLKKQVKNARPLLVSDFFRLNYNTKLRLVQQEIEKHYKESFIEDYISENLKTGELNNYGNLSFEDILELVGRIETRSIPVSNIERNTYPVIVYHHGSNGHPFENFAMAEYFASRGFIFVAASFEIPFENTSFGLLPYERYITDEEEKSVKTVIEFAQSLSNSSSLFYIGHSLGAQMGLRTLGQDTTITGMISLETTLEFKTDYERVQELWPEVYQKVIAEKVYYPFPILFCAAVGEENPFNFIENVKAPHITYVSTNTAFAHNAYTSIFYLRYFIDDNVIRQTDKDTLEKMLTIYIKHLDVLYDFITQTLNNENKTGTETKYVKG